MSDYSMYRMADWEWYDTYRSRLGEKELKGYIGRVYGQLDAMKPGNFFSIEKNVKTENIELFIKICCMYILEIHNNTGNPDARIFEFNDTYTQIKCK